MTGDRAARSGRCPDGGYCHGSNLAAGSPPCEEGACYRVLNAGPLSGVYPEDRWPDLIRARALRAQADSMADRANPDGSINARHVTIESTLRGSQGLPAYIPELDGPGRFLLVRGGTPEAARIAARLEDPEVQAAIRARLEELTAAVASAVRPLLAAAVRTVEAMLPALRDAGLLPEEPPSDPRARALWARRNRSTGPERPAAGRTRRPRNHTGKPNPRGL